MLPAFAESHIKVLNEQNQLLQELAEKSDCVIVGRCADIILREYQPFNIFVYATHYTDKELKRRMAQIDSERSRYRELIDGSRWGDKSAYHLCINTTGLEIKSLIPAAGAFAACYFDRADKE